MSFWIKGDDLLEKYNEIWELVRNSIKKDLIMKLYTIKKDLKIPINYYGGKSTRNSK